MFKTILLTLNGCVADRRLVEYVKSLAKLAQSRVVVLYMDVPVARARGHNTFNRGKAEDIEHLRNIHRQLQSEGINVELEIAYGDPVVEIVRRVQEKDCDLVVMGILKRRSLADRILGTVASHVQDSINLPILVIPEEQTNPLPRST
jgi:nucleotide-binding universal stress UspA family protein